jgi:hypothetical protein
VYFQIENQKPAIATIEGIRTADGQFWPHVKSQVASKLAGNWKTIAGLPRRGDAVTITIKPGENNMNLMVGLDTFQPLVGRYKFGRVILRSGETATFELKDLSSSGKDEPERTPLKK